MNLRRIFFSIALLLFPALETLPWAGNNFILSPEISLAAVSSDNNSAIYNKHDYSFASAQFSILSKLSFNKLPVSIVAQPFVKKYYADIFNDNSKLALANFYGAYSTDNFILKLGRQNFAIPGTEFAIYFGPDDKFDYSFPTYLDGASIFFSNNFFDATLLAAQADADIAGFHVNILPDEFLSFSLFAYMKDLPENKLYLFGAGSKLELSQDFNISAYFALNSGKYKYAVLNQKFLKKYDGYFFKVNSNFNIYPDNFDLLFDIGWDITSPSDKYSFAFTPLSNYNIYGDIAGAEQLFNNSIQAFNAKISLIPSKLNRLNINLNLFYYSSAFDDSYNDYLGSEINLHISYAFNNFNIRFAYAYLSLNDGFLEDSRFSSKDLNKNIQKAAIYLDILNLF